MAFFDELFPTEISRNMTGGPRALTNKAYTQGGQRFVNTRDPEPVHEWNLSTPVQLGEEFELLRAFVYVVGNDRDGFRFEAPDDHTATLANTSLSQISGAVYQMNRLYTYGARTKVRPIYKPVTGAKVFRTRSGVTTDITGTSTIDFATGQVTVVGHTSGDTYRWTGTFHIPVAFRDPAAVWRVIGGRQMLTEAPDIAVEEIREIT